MERYILKYLQDSTQDEWRKRYYDYLKLPLDSAVWSYGSHINRNREEWAFYKANYVIPKKDTLRYLLSKLQKKVTKRNNSSVLHDHNKEDNYDYHIVSVFGDPYMPLDTEARLNAHQIGVNYIFEDNQPWSEAVGRLYNWESKLRILPFNELLKEEYVQELKNIYQSLVKGFGKTNLDAVLVFSAERFESKMLIDVFRDLGKFSIEALHGLPGKSLCEDRVDYILAYGEQVRQNLIDAGYNPDKIYVSGNTKYDESAVDWEKPIRLGFDNVLVMTSATSTGHQHEWRYADFPISDRSLLITYLYSVENVLKRNGVQHARLRPHPTVNNDWLSKYVDLDFYEFDNNNLSDSLSWATCCIGQNSTAVLEAIIARVSYLVYEPGDGKHTLSGGVLVPPFDGSEPYLKVANSEEQLDLMIKEKYKPDTRILAKYMLPFKPEVLKGILEANRKNI